MSSQWDALVAARASGRAGAPTKVMPNGALWSGDVSQLMSNPGGRAALAGQLYQHRDTGFPPSALSTSMARGPMSPFNPLAPIPESEPNTQVRRLFI